MGAGGRGEALALLLLSSFWLPEEELERKGGGLVTQRPFRGSRCPKPGDSREQTCHGCAFICNKGQKS